MSKLTPQEIKDRNKEIVKKLSQGISGSQLARDYDVSPSLISKIKKDNFSSEAEAPEKPVKASKKAAAPKKEAAKAAPKKTAAKKATAKKEVVAEAKKETPAAPVNEAESYKIKIVSPSRSTQEVTKTKELRTFGDLLKDYSTSNTNIGVNIDGKNRSTSDKLPEYLSGQSVLIVTLSTSRARGSK